MDFSSEKTGSEMDDESSVASQSFVDSLNERPELEIPVKITEEEEEFERALAQYEEDDQDELEGAELPMDEIMAMVKDNPIFERFQKTLEEHLLKIKAQLEDEIAVLDHELVETDRQREEVGTELYDIQRQVDRQRAEIHEYASKIFEASERRQKEQEAIHLLSRDLNQRRANLKDAKRIHNEMLRELDNLQVLENEMAKWAKEVKDEVTFAKLAASKDTQLMAAQAEEKRQMDLFLVTLDAEVRRREEELENINEQIAEQEVVIDDLKKSLADANSDLELLQAEQNRLYKSWGEIIVAIQQRDKVLAKAQADLQGEIEQQKCITMAIESTRKASNREQQLIDKLGAIRSRRLHDFGVLQRDFERDSDENAKVLQEIDNFNAILAKTEEDLKHARSEGLVVENHLKRLNQQIDKQNKQKFTLEEKILELLQDQITSDKASDYRAKLLREAQERRRKLEITVSDTERKLARVILQIESYKGLISGAKEHYDALQRQHDEVDETHRAALGELKGIKDEIGQKLRRLDMINKEIDKAVELAGGREINPHEMRIMELENEISALDAEMQEIQGHWMQLQTYIVNISQKRTHQINELVMARKQLLIIEQKALKIEADLAHLEAEKKESDRVLHALNTKFSQLNAKVYETRKQHEFEEHQCETMHQEIRIKLEEAEREILSLENDLVEMQGEIEELKKESMERHHEVLSWETKYRMSCEIKKYRDAELANTGEIAEIKAEIHRMEVRRAQLKRAQEKLLQDLDNSVLQRGHIHDNASCKEKASTHQRSKSRSLLQHKINEVRHKIKTVKHEIAAVESSLVTVSEDQRALDEEVEGKRQDLEDEKMQDKLLQDEIEQGLLLKQENLENIVRKQHRAKCYRKLLNSSTLYKRRSEAVVNQDYERQAEAHEHLINIVESLHQEFPDQKYVTAKILQTLKG